jgi:predicted nucleic acid-binding protein
LIYVDTSVALAWLLAEDRHPTANFWSGMLVSSRLLEYEVWVRIHALGLGRSHDGHVRALLGRIAFLELTPEVLERAHEPFAVPVRTLDALHLATADFLRTHGQHPRIASYDRRLLNGAASLGLEEFPLP